MFNLEAFIRTFSYLGLFGLVFAESGLLVGIVLPGDSLLFLAGFMASQHAVNIAGLITVVFVAAVLGNSVGYAIGRRFGRQLFKKSSYLKPEQVDQAEHFFSRHGGKAVIISRFVPVVRTLVPPLAGIGQMDYGRFSLYNIVGALFWTTSVCLLGYFLGKSIPNIDHYILPIIAIVIVVSLLPSAWHYFRNRSSSTQN
ncbi:MAG TPA: DedA family protein [Candidatus Saccharimonadales bacterium]|nr:DedA family protein [Candidatus Saccharimonadales bacterium]